MPLEVKEKKSVQPVLSTEEARAMAKEAHVWGRGWLSFGLRLDFDRSHELEFSLMNLPDMVSLPRRWCWVGY